MNSQKLFPVNKVNSLGQYGNLKDIDNLPSSGFYQCLGLGGISGSVPTSTYGYGILVHLTYGDYGLQLLMTDSSDKTTTLVHGRVRADGAWRAWVAL